MRNHPSVVYMPNMAIVTRRNSLGVVDTRRGTVTLAFKVVQDLDGLQHLAAAVAIPHPQEAFITETMDTHMGLDSFPKDLEVPRGKFPFVKSEGRDRALSRLSDAITRLPAETNFRGEGYACASNTNVNICQGGYYQLLKRFVYVPEGQVIPFLDMAKPLLTQMALEMFVHKDNKFEAWMGTSLDNREAESTYLDLHVAFPSGACRI